MMITTLTEASEAGAADISRLLVQLRENKDEHSASLAELEVIVNDPNAFLVVAKDESRIIGMGTLYVQNKFSKKTAFVEDVVVDDAYRGKGIGKEIMNAILEIAKKENVRTVYLTSRPKREAAHALYTKLGFEKKDTTVFRLKL